MEEKDSIKEYDKFYIRNVFKIVFIACISISLSVIITGVLGYNNTKKALIEKAKSQDIVYIVKSMAAKIDSRISRAVETSQIFAKDPINIKWLREQEEKASDDLVLNRVESIAKSYDYSNFFIASTKTRHYYYSENFGEKHMGVTTLSKDNQQDNWFDEMIESKKNMELNVNYDRAMDDSFLFVNILMGEVNDPIGITGVGLSLNEITKEFQNFKVGSQSNLWMVDNKGIIQLSDKKDDIGRKYNEFIPQNIFDEIKNKSQDTTENVNVSQYVNENNEIMDYAYCKLASSDWILFYKIPRAESISLIDSLKFNTFVNVFLIILFFMVLFYFISKKIANPYKQAILINKELENKVNIRTQELKESNEKINASIEYAKRLQESILPSEDDLKRLFKENFVIWKPRDIVGGDFFWIREIDDVVVLAVGDCTGHGVPGAFMTMTVNAVLHNIVNDLNKEDPSLILQELHIQLKQALNKESNSNSVDDGLDVAIFSIKKKSTLSYVGANIDLYIKRNKEVQVLNSQSKGVGYSYIEIKKSLKNEVIQIQEEDIFIVTTDGLLHQNGGEKNYPFGKKRLHNMMEKCEAADLTLIKKEFENTLELYMRSKEQRDDITVFAFKLK